MLQDAEASERLVNLRRGEGAGFMAFAVRIYPRNASSTRCRKNALLPAHSAQLPLRETPVVLANSSMKRRLPTPGMHRFVRAAAWPARCFASQRIGATKEAPGASPARSYRSSPFDTCFGEEKVRETRRPKDGSHD